MNAEQKHLNPSDLTTEQLDRIAFAIMGHLNRYGLFIPRPMKMKEAMAFCQVSRTTFQHWINIGKIKDHRVDEKGNPLFLPDEMYQAIKNS
jgi:hypothetical protein